MQGTPSKYFLGGRTGSRTTLNKVQVYSHWYNTWQQVVTMAEGTSELAVSVIPNVWRFCHHYYGGLGR